ncbi:MULTISPECIES: lysis protein [unclassified Proteus (in: enterobacteria)]|uniref:lysis protein n=1 Tax=unclassified Proteus (in: enterobacteria) TaxID=257482 RepID=UPI0013779E71|nr:MULTISPECIES: lysis protein [unclassified Proteus (in: enterobacteria)]NBM03873.1 lysis protein [Proteus sp. G2671]NBM69206.1 lysis protein [Proteus sp. G2663]
MKLGETTVSVGIILVMSIGMVWQGNRIDKLKISNAELTSHLSQQVEINKDYQVRIARLNQLDTRHTQELVDAKNEISQLRDLSERYPERVYIKANCPKSEGVTTSGVDNAITARPTDSAIRNYWLLRERIAQSEQIIKGLQSYIKTQCLL